MNIIPFRRTASKPAQKKENKSISLNCRFGWHSWNKWEVIRRIDYTSGAAMVNQERACSCCGKIQVRSATTW